MGSRDIRIHLASTFNPSGVDKAKKSMSDLGRAAMILGNGMGGAFAKIGNLAKDLLTGGIWAAGAHAVMFFWDSFISPSARAERALAKTKRQAEELHKAVEASLSAMASSYSRNHSQIDGAVKRRERTGRGRAQGGGRTPRRRGRRRHPTRRDERKAELDAAVQNLALVCAAISRRLREKRNAPA